MNILRKHAAPVLALAALAASAGCRNHMATTAEENTQYRRNALPPVYSIEMPGGVPRDAALEFKVSEQLDTEVEVVQNRTVFERYTPYNGWLELYEVPTGLVLFPVAVVSHVFSAVSFNMYPFTWSMELSDFSFACMNPALNAEWESRSVLEQVSATTTVLDTFTESRTVPAARLALELRSGSKRWSVTANDKGAAEFALLNFDAVTPVLGSGDREISIGVAGSNEVLATAVISRELLRRLDQGFKILLRYRLEPTGANLASAIDQLEALNFLKLAYQLEMREREANRDNPEFMKEFEEK